MSVQGAEQQEVLFDSVVLTYAGGNQHPYADLSLDNNSNSNLLLIISISW